MPLLEARSHPVIVPDCSEWAMTRRRFQRSLFRHGWIKSQKSCRRSLPFKSIYALDTDHSPFYSDPSGRA